MKITVSVDFSGSLAKRSVVPLCRFKPLDSVVLKERSARVGRELISWSGFILFHASKGACGCLNACFVKCAVPNQDTCKHP